jgi:hypothetical protein
MPTFILGCVLAVATTLGRQGPARADRNDLKLANLCPTSGGTACPWITQSATSTTVNLSADPDATSRFRSLMSELGVVVAPRLQTPADTLGFAGLQVSAELGMTEISRDKSFWNGVEGVTSSNPSFSRPDAWLTTIGAFVRRGMWYPVPALEWGVGAVNVLQSGMWAIQGYLKVALHEGFHAWTLPSVAVRAGISQVVGTSQVTLTVGSLDVLISKAFSLAGTARLEPFVGWDFLFIDARSGVIDGTPTCDAATLQQARPTDPQTTALAGCPLSQFGTPADLGANFRFPRQDIITRNRVYVGAKLRLAMLFLVAEISVTPKGSSRDQRVASAGARDTSGTQRSASLSAGFDF